ncbi:hypothetical protein HN51_029344 [Arachis hypogaea]|uniref:precursor of CEP16 n=1 Tax=Arachis stenosperma TaxID=217475 RepID=UPI0025AD151A|nr:precursor of CEP16 [Arachis stenosperma]
MDTRPLKCVCVTFLLTLILLASVSESRPLNSPVNGVLRTLKNSGPSPGKGHMLKKLQNFAQIKHSGPSPGIGHKVNNSQNLGDIKESGPSPGVGH